MQEINQWKKSVAEGENPRDIKVRLALEIVARFHNQTAALTAHENFVARFKRHEIPEDLPNIQLICESFGLRITQLLKQANLVSSTSDAIRMIQQGAVKIDGEHITSDAQIIRVDETHVYQVGKRRFAKVTLKSIAKP